MFLFVLFVIFSTVNYCQLLYCFIAKYRLDYQILKINSFDHRTGRVTCTDACSSLGICDRSSYFRRDRTDKVTQRKAEILNIKTKLTTTTISGSNYFRQIKSRVLLLDSQAGEQITTTGSPTDRASESNAKGDWVSARFVRLLQSRRACIRN